MSKYATEGAYHYKLFKTEGDPYRLHVLDVIEKVKEHLPGHARLLDVGCGEGLVIRALLNRGFEAEGLEIDEDAIRLGRSKGNPIHRMMIQDVVCNESAEQRYDAVLMLDVLEHVEDLQTTVSCAQDLADLIFIAVPDREDPGALRQFIQSDVMVLFGPDWECIHQEQRHARHFLVYRLRVEPEEIAPAQARSEFFDT
ncbi:MAG: methyltransferase domain-containing protein [bacterium]|nr:methyltransferase domain-containing protein [bacterium]